MDHQAAGRFAPSPSGDMHFGNLRTALIAWACARTTGRRFVLRIEDIDAQRSSRESAERQIEDLHTLGLDWDGEVVHQSQRAELYQQAVDRLPVYECYCSRRDIQEASRAPHVAPGWYPGICRHLTDQQREEARARLAAQGRHPALRLRSTDPEIDDFVLRRGGQDTGWAYNLAVVVDDHDQGIDQVVRGDDLVSSTPRQEYLGRLLGYKIPHYIHVPLVLNKEGRRLAKRDGAVTLREMLERSTVSEVIRHLTESMGFPGVDSVTGLLAVFDLSQLNPEPYVWGAD